MDTRTMWKRNALRALLAVLAVAGLVGCGDFGGGGTEEGIVGTWTASESMELFSATLQSRFELTFTESQVRLVIDTTKGGVLEHRLEATGGYAYSPSLGTLGLTFQNALQTADVLTPGASAAALAALSAEDLADLAADFPAGLQCDLAASSLTLRFANAPDLAFTRTAD